MLLFSAPNAIKYKIKEALNAVAVYAASFLEKMKTPLAASCKPKAVSGLLDLIASLNDPLDRNAIIKKVDSAGYNVLMLATRYCPEAVHPLLSVIAQMDDFNDKAAILEQRGERKHFRSPLCCLQSRRYRIG